MPYVVKLTDVGEFKLDKVMVDEAEEDGAIRMKPHNPVNVTEDVDT